MNIELIENTKVASFFLWEYSKHDNALDLWYCAEDMACFLERNDILSMDQLNHIKNLGIYDPAYVAFVRHLAFRVYIYTKKDTCLANWFVAEKLLYNDEWCQAVTGMANIFMIQKNDNNITSVIRSNNVRSYYGSLPKKPDDL